MELDAFFRFGFLQRALVAGLLLSIIAGLLSPWVVLRRLSFSTDGLAHASLGGLAIGMTIFSTGSTPSLASYAVSFLFTCVVAAAIAFFSGHRRLQAETAVGACYVAAFALGVVLLSMSNKQRGHLEHLFFGSILSVTWTECVLLGGLLLSSMALTWGGWRWLGSWAVDEELARTNGIPVSLLRYSLILLIAAAVVVSTRVVGVLIVTALFILPGTMGCLVGRTMGKILLVSVGTAMTSVTLGMMAANRVNVPPGPATVLVLFGFFMAVFFWRRHVERRAATGIPMHLPHSS